MVDIFDPSYFVAFAFAEGDPIAVEGLPDGCSFEVNETRRRSTRPSR